MGRKSIWLVALLFALVGSAQEARAQVSFGGYVVRTTESLDTSSGDNGFGLRAALSFPLLPLSAYASAERVFPSCDGCSVWGAEAGLKLNILPVPIASPYLTGGMVRRRIDRGVGEDPTSSNEAITIGVGFAAGLPGIQAFVEGRYEFFDDPDDGFVFRLGVLF